MWLHYTDNVAMKIGLIDCDSHNFPNLALMKISGWHKSKGDVVEWAKPKHEVVQSDLFNTVEAPTKNEYDRIYASKIFTFSPDFDRNRYHANEFELGGTGYDIKKCLPEEIDKFLKPDYSIYPQYPFSIQFFSRGCIRHCPFCLVHDKEGGIHPVEPMQLNPNGKWIEVLDNNFFASPSWKSAIDYLMAAKQPVNFHGVDVRIMDEEQAYWLNKLRLKNNIHIAWDLPQIDLTEKLKAIVKYIKPYKITCYVLIGFNSTREQDLFRLNTLKQLNILPFVQPYRDYSTNRVPTRYEKDLQRWANRAWLFRSIDFEEYEPRKGFKCKAYFNETLSVKCYHLVRSYQP